MLFLQCLKQLNPHLGRGCIVTDVGSTKVSIVGAAQEKLANSMMFVGSHPVAGSEKRGVENAIGELFANTTCIMTPVDGTHQPCR